MEPVKLETGEELITGRELLEMGDIGRCELIDGRIVPMSPTSFEHGQIEATLASELNRFVRERNLGTVVTGEVGIYTRRDPDRVRAADVAFISHARTPQREHGFLELAPDVVVEIVSPGDSWQDLWQKIEEYLSVGAEQVWIVEPKNRAVRVYHSPTEMTLYGPNDRLTATGALEGFELTIATLF